MKADSIVTLSQPVILGMKTQGFQIIPNKVMIKLAEGQKETLYFTPSTKNTKALVQIAEVEGEMFANLQNNSVFCKD